MLLVSDETAKQVPGAYPAEQPVFAVFSLGAEKNWTHLERAGAGPGGTKTGRLAESVDRRMSALPTRVMSVVAEKVQSNTCPL